MTNPTIVRRPGDVTSRYEGIPHVTDGTLLALSPTEEAELIVEAAEPGPSPVWWRERHGLFGTGSAMPFVDVLHSPRRAFRATAETFWRTGVAVTAGAALLRAAAFIVFELYETRPMTELVTGTLVGLVSPFLFVAVVAGLLWALSAVLRSPRTPLSALSVAFLTSAPLVWRSLLQTTAMAITGHPVHPTGIVGLLPGAPQALQTLLGPLDLFGGWAVVLVIVAAVLSGKRPPRASATAPNMERADA